MDSVNEPHNFTFINSVVEKASVSRINSRTNNNVDMKEEKCSDAAEAPQKVDIAASRILLNRDGKSQSTMNSSSSSSSSSSSHSPPHPQPRPHRSTDVQYHTFPTKLHYMLDHGLEEDEKSIIHWQPHGRCFIVCDQHRFVSILLPNWFRQNKYQSFQRQLNSYGFQRITQGCDRGCYYHSHFLRSRVELCAYIKRVKIKGNGGRKPSNPDMEPNFYLLPPMPLPRPFLSSLLKSIQEKDKEQEKEQPEMQVSQQRLNKCSNPSQQQLQHQQNEDQQQYLERQVALALSTHQAEAAAATATRLSRTEPSNTAATTTDALLNLLLLSQRNIPPPSPSRQLSSSATPRVVDPCVTSLRERNIPHSSLQHSGDDGGTLTDAKKRCMMIMSQQQQQQSPSFPNHGFVPHQPISSTATTALWTDLIGSGSVVGGDQQTDHPLCPLSLSAVSSQTLVLAQLLNESRRRLELEVQARAQDRRLFALLLNSSTCINNNNGNNLSTYLSNESMTNPAPVTNKKRLVSCDDNDDDDKDYDHK